MPGGGLRVGPQHGARAAARGGLRALPGGGHGGRGDPRDGNRAEAPNRRSLPFATASAENPPPGLLFYMKFMLRSSLCSRSPCWASPLSSPLPAATTSRPSAVAKVGDADDHPGRVRPVARDRGQGPGRRAARRPCRTRPTSRSASRPRRRRPCPKGQAKPTDAELKKQCKQEFDPLKSEVMQFLIQAEWVQQEAEERDIEVSDKAVAEVLRGSEEAGLPDRQGLPGVPQDLGHDRGGHPLPREARPAPAEADAEGHRGREEGLRRGHRGVLRQEQEALRAARAPRPPRGR